MTFQQIIELVGQIIDGAGVAVIVVGAIAASASALRTALRRSGPVYAPFRRFLGRSILLGLELLVAADIIRTVAVAPTLDSVVVLGLIVLIRTFLSFSLELEITGRWPWQKRADASAEADVDAE
ncbi:putative membrane protein [Conyzicola nivalis]|uniref:Membrane protein n=1 Tax=Conyzicola nivalis TaxID=1477021 RepID=A0ABV2QQB0_9MICO